MAATRQPLTTNALSETCSFKVWGWKIMTKTKMVLAAALVLGATFEASAKGGGGVMRCSLSGVNTALHGNIFGKKHIEATREYGFVKLSDSGGRHGTWEVDPSVCGPT